ncbi:4317_t:CDS:2 [Funneliformis geosporum]|uniref:7440_t:CDS:1 n=1 Tax=Funneliformis geosporum TaxID=1117311 RepID=A0A9W4T176_9GLOM|nr:7440_t:CDS:2 [Funneliformis geosporum]CAI2189341.1 4317_t:CDS:2 [Funneliformis geosporum]
MAIPISLLIKRPGFTSIMSEIRYNFNRYKSENATSFKEQPSNNLPLAGFRVIDLTRILAGPYCTMLLGDLGAEIIKIENPKNGDDSRIWGPPWAHNKDPNDKSIPESTYFLSVNRNKKSITVNFKTQLGAQIIKDLVKTSDILVENYLPGTLSKIGLGYDELSKINPKLIYASITGYGQTGPYAHRSGYDVIVEAEAGLMYITGEQDRDPVKVGVAITDLTTGLYTHGAIMAAILSRIRTNQGQRIDCSLIDCQVASLANIGSNFLIANQEAERMGTSHPSIVPYQKFKTKDGYILIGAGNNRQYEILCNSVNGEELLQDERFKTNSDRVKNREVLIKLLEDKFIKKDTEHWLSIFADKSFPFAPINNIKKTFEHPQVIARNMIQEVDHPRAGKIKLTGIPVKYSKDNPSIRLPPPTLGQHTHEVLTNILNYSEDKIKTLIKGNVIV